MNNNMERIYNGLIKENPTFILMLGMCPTLAVTTSATNGMGMGLSTMVVLIASNFVISLLRNIIPDKVRLPAYIIVIAAMVTVVQLLIQAYVPALYASLGIFIPLIVVNCIIMGRAESYASKNPPVASVFDGIGMGLGFTVALTIIGIIRELFGNGTVFGAQIMPSFYKPMAVLVKAPGAFLVMALIVAFMNGMAIKNNANKKVEEGCTHDCAHCGSGCDSKKEEKA